MFERALNRRGLRASRRAPPPVWPGSGLHLCSTCRGDFVQATERRRELDARWLLRLRCGQCGACRDVLVSDDLAQRFDADVSRGLAAIASAATTLDGERMAALVEVFAAALQHDLIDTGDFRP